MSEADDRSDKFSIQGSDLIVSQCHLCTHRARPATFAVCKAFPGGIPQEILDNHVDHRRPFEGDEGMGAPGTHVLFEPREGVSISALANLYATLDALPRS